MAFFFNNYKFFNEVEVNGQQMTDEQPAPDYNAEDQAAENQTQPAEQQPIEGPGDPNMQPATEEPVDYTQMDAQQGSPNQDAQSMPSQDGGGQPAQEEESEVDDLKMQEEDMYANMTPEQLDIMHKELKLRFLDLYDTTTNIIERINDVSPTEDNIGIVEYVSTTLSNLRNTLTDYVNAVYQTKSYIENSINYNKFLAVMHGINRILEEMNKKGE